jgi:hypothetical protein
MFLIARSRTGDTYPSSFPKTEVESLSKIMLSGSRTSCWIRLSNLGVSSGRATFVSFSSCSQLAKDLGSSATGDGIALYKVLCSKLNQVEYGIDVPSTASCSRALLAKYPPPSAKGPSCNSRTWSANSLFGSWSRLRSLCDFSLNSSLVSPKEMLRNNSLSHSRRHTLEVRRSDPRGFEEVSSYTCTSYESCLESDI